MIVFFLFGCRTAPTDLRNLAPAETLVYMETNDLGKTLDALTKNDVFKKVAAKKKDFSALENIRFAVAVTGFQKTEKQVSDEQAVLNFKPRFVAFAETRAWEFQTVSLAENQIGEFVNEIYGGEVNLEITGKNGGKRFEWTAKDGRKAFAFVEGSLIFFGNDDTAIEKCLAVKRGEAENLAKNESFARAYKFDQENLAFGYVSADGVAQIANIFAASTAVEASEDELPRSFIADILPQIVQKSIGEIVWTARKSERGIEDIFQISTSAEVSAALMKTRIPADQKIEGLWLAFVPPDIYSVTRYELQTPQAAWRNLVSVATKQTDELNGKILTEIASVSLESYNISDAETFLGAVGSRIVTLQYDAEGEKKVVIADVKDGISLKKSVTEINFNKTPESIPGGLLWKSDDGKKSAVLGGVLILGDSESVLKCSRERLKIPKFENIPFSYNAYQSNATAVTLGKKSSEKIIEFLGEKRQENLNTLTNFMTETRFSEKGVERKSISPFGFIGTILEQLAE